MRYRLNHAGILIPHLRGIIDASDYPSFTIEQIQRGLTVPAVADIDTSEPGYQREAERIIRRNRRLRG